MNWTTPTTPLTINGIRGNILSTSIRVNSFPSMAVDRTGGARNGYVYVTWAQRNLAPAGSDADICFAYSSNGGNSWSSPVKVNDDPLNNGKNQFFPWMTIDQTNGNIAIVFYDTRDVSSTDSCHTYIAYSTNGGSLFVNMRVSDHAQRPVPLSGYAAGYYGDYIGIVAHSNVIWPFWMDNRNGPAQVYTSKVTLGPSPAHDISVGPFMNLPSLFLVNSLYNIKTQVSNLGSSNETGIPIKFLINGNLINTTNINLNTGQQDSVNNTWTPNSAGSYTLTYVSALANDTNRYNDTLKTTVSVLTSLPDLCEGFTGSTFPPAQWTSSGSYWLRNGNVSGFGLGTGAAYYNCWIAPQNENEDLKTLSFNPTLYASDSLIFDYAYSPYPSSPPYSQDSLVVMASTNGGSSWISLVRLGPTDLQTAPASSSEFTPTASQWAIKRLVLPIGTSRIDFLGKSQYGNDFFIDSTCVKHPVGIVPLSNNIPNIYSLSQNYPNPFNPVTTIKFGIPKQGLVKMVVSDILGREVMLLVKEVRSAGNYEVKFDGSNLASGVYFYKIEAGDFVEVKKMVLIK